MAQALEHGTAASAVCSLYSRSGPTTFHMESSFSLIGTLQGGCHSAGVIGDKAAVQGGALGRQWAFLPVNPASLFFVTCVIC